MVKTLAELKLGDIAKIISLDGLTKACQQKLLAFGLIPGAMLSVIRVSPFGGLFQIQLDGDIMLSVRKSEGHDVKVELA